MERGATWLPTVPCTPQLEIPLRLPYGQTWRMTKGGSGCLYTSCYAVNASPFLLPATPFATRHPFCQPLAPLSSAEGGSSKQTVCYMGTHSALHVPVADPPVPAFLGRLGG